MSRTTRKEQVKAVVLRQVCCAHTILIVMCELSIGEKYPLNIFYV